MSDWLVLSSHWCRGQVIDRGRILSLDEQEQVDSDTIAQLLAAGRIVPANKENLLRFRTETRSSLAPKEIKILEGVAANLTNKGIASRLHLSEWTVKTYLKTISQKLDIHGRTGLALFWRYLVLTRF